jgi:diadenosine tetraphosphatase ApaH/serine/threonine PP2A family protein phosphatase
LWTRRARPARPTGYDGRDIVRHALLSDIHANLEALDGCLAHAREHGADAHAFLGDLVGYGADAAAVVERVRDYASRGAVAIKGNHDDALERPAGYFNDQARAALDWARETLDAGARAFLAGLPMIVRDDPVCYVHASADRPERWTYVDSAATAAKCVAEAHETFTFCGHVHDQRLYFETPHGKMSPFVPTPGTPIPLSSRRRWLAIVGSVGQPRDRRTAAAYALYDDERREITFHRVPYDAKAAADKIRRAGLPGALAHRVELGI